MNCNLFRYVKLRIGVLLYSVWQSVIIRVLEFLARERNFIGQFIKTDRILAIIGNSNFELAGSLKI